MLEILLCSLVTVLPDYLFRRYVQGKRFGKEITLYSVWYELQVWHNIMPPIDHFSHNSNFLLPSIGLKRRLLVPDCPNSS